MIYFSVTLEEKSRCEFLSGSKLVMSGVDIAKHYRWNSTNGQWVFPYFTEFSSDGILQKQIPTPACGISSEMSYFLEYHLPKFSGKTRVLQKVVTFGKQPSRDYGLVCFGLSFLLSKPIFSFLAETEFMSCILAYGTSFTNDGKSHVHFTWVRANLPWILVHASM